MYLPILLGYNPMAICQFAFVQSIKGQTKTILIKLVIGEI